MQIYNSIYLGICVQNNDPEHRGRIKVWVPHVSTTVGEKWNNLKSDQEFSFPGVPGGENLSGIIEKLKDDLPWAEYCGPIGGSSTSGYYNSYFDTNTVSDAPFIYSFKDTNYTTSSSGTTLDNENKGGKPGLVYEKYPVTDAFTNTSKINSLYANQYGGTYKPSTYSNAAKGIFSIPNVGAHVWVFFRDGIPAYPVYIGVSFGQQDFESIFQHTDGSLPDYPGSFENKNYRSQSEINNDTVTYRNKMVVNQRGAAIEIVNTTDRESYKVTHYSGSYFEQNNKYTALFNANNYQLLTLRDKFETVNGNNSSFTKRDFDNIIQGNYFLKIGNFNQTAINAWAVLMNEITTSAKTDPSTIESLVNEATEQLAEQEKEMGFGGNSFEFIAKHKVSVIGLKLNESPSYKLSSSVYTLPIMINPGEITTRDFNIFEPLYVPDMPGGNYDIFANSRINIKSGAGGMSLQTTGIQKISGSITNIHSKQVNINGNEVNINTDVVFNLTSNEVYLKNKNVNGQIVLDSTTGITKNLLVQEGAHIGKELFVHHITAPYEYQVTESSSIKALPGRWRIVGGNLTGTASPASTTSTWNIQITNAIIEGGVLVIDQPHNHVFKNVPLTLVKDSATVKTAAESLVEDETSELTEPKQIYSSPNYSLPKQPTFPVANGYQT